jgi:hypothetical protein
VNHDSHSVESLSSSFFCDNPVSFGDERQGLQYLTACVSHEFPFQPQERNQHSGISIKNKNNKFTSNDDSELG